MKYRNVRKDFLSMFLKLIMWMQTNVQWGTSPGDRTSHTKYPVSIIYSMRDLVCDVCIIVRDKPNYDMHHMTSMMSELFLSSFRGEFHFLTIF